MLWFQIFSRLFYSDLLSSSCLNSSVKSNPCFTFVPLPTLLWKYLLSSFLSPCACISSCVLRPGALFPWPLPVPLFPNLSASIRICFARLPTDILTCALFFALNNFCIHPLFSQTPSLDMSHWFPYCFFQVCELSKRAQWIHEHL